MPNPVRVAAVVMADHIRPRMRVRKQQWSAMPPSTEGLRKASIQVSSLKKYCFCFMKVTK